MTSAFSWQNSVSLCPASFCTPRPNLPVTLGIFWLPSFSCPLWWKGHLFLVLVPEGLVGHHRTNTWKDAQHHSLSARESKMQYLDAMSKTKEWSLFQGKPFSIIVIQVCAPISNAEEAEVEWFYEHLQDLLALTPKKDVLFIIGDWNAKVGSQETPGVTGTFGLRV